MLSNPKTRTPLHTREVTFNGYAREDGLWDIEGHLVDIKAHPFTTGSKTWQPGEAIHDMWVRVTVTVIYIFKTLKSLWRATRMQSVPQSSRPWMH